VRLRPSALPVIMHCSMAATLPEVVEPRTQAMLDGIERHRKLAQMPEKALEAFSRSGFPDVHHIQTEVPVTLPGLSGTCDVLAMDGQTSSGPEEPIILDWKGPWDDSDATDQVQAYMAGTGAWATVVANVNDDLDILSVETIEYDPQWLLRLEKHLAAPPRYSVGDWCQRCTSFRLCEAQSGLLGGIVPLEAGELTTATMGKAWETIANWERAIEKAKEIIKARAQTEAIPLPSGKVLTVVEQARESIDAVRAAELIPGMGARIKMSLAKSDVSQDELIQLRRGGATSTKLINVVREIKP
jgi:hypothetical protein